jgi:putative ATP-dependent endonuclease of OLD family
MRISSLRLCNYRCFGPEPVTIALHDITAFVGTNGSGKSAVLQAVTRLFGVGAGERELERGDFHVPVGKTLEDVGETTLFIEARLDFPEIEKTDDEDNTEDGDDSAVAECFRHMTVADGGETPYCRIRLEGSWSPSSLPDGDISQAVCWVTTTADEPTDADKRPLRPADRSHIQVLYVPASRDPLRQVRQVSGSMLHHLLKAVRWSEEVRKGVEEASEELATRFSEEEGVETIEDALRSSWQSLHPGKLYSEVSVRPTARRFDEILKRIETIFSPGPGKEELPIDRLSDGMKSLFYLAIVAAGFNVYEQVCQRLVSGSDDEDEEPIIASQLDPPLLMVLAIEEPENHLSPHYLGRIMAILREMAGATHGQVLLTSHSASILSRIEPEEIRFLRLDNTDSTTVARQIVLPKETNKAYQYVREAVRAYPELYFARLVILGEGDSEEIVIPRLSDARGLQVDHTFVSIVPLGGRHVNHFWRLLHDLEIPHITILDLDLERTGGGWGRIKYACQQLIACGVSREELLAVEGGTVLSKEEFLAMHTWEPDLKTMRSWMNTLERYGVFFSAPLDLDFMMLESFPSEYAKIAKKGPNIPEGKTEYEQALNAAIDAVLKEDNSGGKLYSTDQLRLFFWYRYLFLNRGKPVSHLLALSEILPGDLIKGAPKVLRRLVTRMKAELGDATEDEGDGD